MFCAHSDANLEREMNGHIPPYGILASHSTNFQVSYNLVGCQAMLFDGHIAFAQHTTFVGTSRIYRSTTNARNICDDKKKYAKFVVPDKIMVFDVNDRECFLFLLLS